MELTHSMAALQRSECQRNVTDVMKSQGSKEVLAVERQAVQKAPHTPRGTIPCHSPLNLS